MFVGVYLGCMECTSSRYVRSATNPIAFALGSIFSRSLDQDLFAIEIVG